MTSLAYQSGTDIQAADELARDVKDAIRQAREARKNFEPTWHSNLAFAAGQFWKKWDRHNRRLIDDPDQYGRNLYTTDVITEYRTTALGELGSEDDRPELLLVHDDLPSEDYAAQLNDALGWAWDHEMQADEALEEMRRLVLDFGTAAIRVRFDPTVGPVVGELPSIGGMPVFDPQAQTELFANGPNPLVQMREIQQGRIALEALTPFNLLVPPGIPHERYFPWECVLRPALLSSVQAEYGDVAAGLKEDTDIGSLYGFDTTEANAHVASSNYGQKGRVRGHVWLFTFYERPCPKYPQGRTVVLATNELRVLSIEQKLPHEKPDGSFASGISYFHWWRVTGRFWSRSLIEVMKDPQRSINERRTQSHEIIRRGLPAIFVAKNSKAKDRKGLPNELIEIGQEERQPTVFNGVSPGEWMYADVEAMRDDLEHATGIRGPRLGENPANVTTYAQLAMLNENDMVKRSSIHRDQRQGIARMIESVVYCIKTYWGAERLITIAGENDELEARNFDATKIPPFYIVKVPTGAALPRSQGAELKKVEEIWNAALASGAVMLSPHEWVTWYADSLEAGQMLALPDNGQNEHVDKAELENHAIRAGALVPVQYYDPSGVHIPIHREAQIKAELEGNVQLWQAFEDHIQLHVLTEMATAGQMAQMAPPMMPGPPPEQPPPEQPPPGAAPPA